MRILRFSLRPGAALLISLLLQACATYGVEKYAPLEQSRLVSMNATNSARLSLMTRRYITSENLLARCTAERLICILDIDTEIRATRRGILAVYASELAFEAGKSRKVSGDTFARLNASALVYASEYLFSKELRNRPSEYHPGRRLAIDLYNRSLAQVVRHLRARRALSRPVQRLPLIRGSLDVSVIADATLKMPNSFLDILAAYDYRALGFANHQSYYGVGTPLILVRRYNRDPLARKPDLQDKPGKPRRERSYQFLGKADQAYPATAVFSGDGSYFSSNKKIHRGRIRVVDTLKETTVPIGDKQVTLEVDLSTPMAYMLAGAEQNDSLLRRLDGDSISSTSGLYMLYPYDPDKIPVVFVHGLASSPMTWFPMLNELLAEERIRRKYQFWVYWYPTSNPVEFSAHGLRKTLKEARKRFGFDNLLLVGHSMGGLLSRLMIQKSRSIEWLKEAKIETKRLEKLDKKTRDFLIDVTTYDPLPFVKRVIFLAVPHRGATLANGCVGYLGRQLFAVPNRLLSVLDKSIELLVGDREGVEVTAPSGIASLSPDGLFVRVTMKQPFAKDIPYHSIIGSRSGANLDWITDSVVPYASSHLPGAASELLVQSDHSVQATMPAILEVRRLLLLHLDLDKK